MEERRGWREERSEWVEYLYYDHAQIKQVSSYLTTNNDTAFLPSEKTIFIFGIIIIIVISKINRLF